MTYGHYRDLSTEALVAAYENTVRDSDVSWANPDETEMLSQKASAIARELGSRGYTLVSSETEDRLIN